MQKHSINLITSFSLRNFAVMNLMLWNESFLTHSSQHVVVKGISSFIAAVLSGVPYGYVVGPLLFILFSNDKQLCIKHSIIRFFADDTQILKHISCQKHVSEIQEDLNSVIQWANQNIMAHMKISLSLWSINIVHNHAFTSSHLLQMNFRIMCIQLVNVLYPGSQVKDLGISISSDLSWSIHVNIMCTRARSVAAWVHSTFKTGTESQL